MEAEREARKVRQESIAQARALIEQKAGVHYEDVPVKTTIAEHGRRVTEFRSKLSLQFPEMSNRESDRIAAIARLVFWPGVANNFNGMLWPNEVNDEDVSEVFRKAKEEAREAFDIQKGV